MEGVTGMTAAVRISRRVAMMMCTGGLMIGGASVAAASTGTNTSPNGDLTVSSSLSSSTDRDRDGNPDTAQAGDTVSGASSVRNNASTSQTVTVTYTLDAPGTAYDTSHTDQLTLGAGESSTYALTLVLNGRFPEGLYQLTTTATAGETASATGSILVQ
jgi:hypothetical protein